ncbi:MAG: nitrogenase molybdenum-iron protein, alpha and beta chain [Oscillospiraceae bacterium]|jgi:nitrogenase molybdenum-iron protein beta chain|nr:nitrogenase molybdenum-iron protein, alpha and beta chain [Oscillospiraceae bacterium]
MACSEQSRVACGIGGFYTALAIESVLPILHSGPGCLFNVAGVLALANGRQSAITYYESSIPSTNFCEEDVIFGGVERLRNLTAKALEYYKTDLVIIVDGCTAEIVGDDIEEVANDFADSETPVIFASLPGFKGNNVWGHSQILNAIVDQYLTKPSKGVQKGLVNIFGVLPYYDPFWLGTLEQLENLLTDIGLTPNIIYGPGKGIEAVNQIPDAEFNLLVGPWVDLDIVEKLKVKFGTPYLHYPCVPVGATEIAAFIRAVSEYAKLDSEKTEAYIKKNEDRYYSYLWRFNRMGGVMFPQKFYVNASASAAVSFTRFLINDVGLIPQKIFISENVPEEHHAQIEKWLREPKYDGIKDYEIVFTDDGGLCDVEIKGLKSTDLELTRACLFGTTWDELTAKNNGFPFVSISAPYGDRAVVNKSYFGYDGGITFFADLYNDCIYKFLGSGSVANIDVQPEAALGADAC